VLQELDVSDRKGGLGKCGFASARYKDAEFWQFLTELLGNSED
jgi:hypothetical protein